MLAHAVSLSDGTTMQIRSRTVPQKSISQPQDPSSPSTVHLLAAAAKSAAVWQVVASPQSLVPPLLSMHCVLPNIPISVDIRQRAWTDVPRSNHLFRTVSSPLPRIQRQAWP